MWHWCWWILYFLIALSRTLCGLGHSICSLTFLTLHLSMYLHLDRHFFSCFYYVSLKTKSITPKSAGEVEWKNSKCKEACGSTTLRCFPQTRDFLTNKTKCPFVSNHIRLPFQFYMSCGYCWLSEAPWSWVCSQKCNYNNEKQCPQWRHQMWWRWCWNCFVSVKARGLIKSRVIIRH